LLEIITEKHTQKTRQKCDYLFACWPAIIRSFVLVCCRFLYSFSLTGFHRTLTSRSKTEWNWSAARQ